MTACAPAAAVPAAPKPRLALVTLLVLAAHALLLLGIPHWTRTVPVTGGPPVFQFQTRTLAPIPAQPVVPAASPAPEPRQPKPPPKPRPAPRPIPDIPPIANIPRSGTATSQGGLPLPVLPLSDARPPVSPAPALMDERPSLLQAPPLVTFGGKTPLPPIIAPLPPDQAIAATQQAAQPDLAGSAAPDASTPGTPDSPPQIQLPRPAEITYQAAITQDGRLVTLPSTINWRHDGQFYDLRWTLYGPAIGDRSRYVTGFITTRGLAPVTARAMGSDAYELTFDYVLSQLRSQPSPAVSAPGGAAPDTAPARLLPAGPTAVSAFMNNVPLLPGTQDFLSALLELSALTAGNPLQYPVSSRISLPVARGDGQPAQPMDFTLADDEDLAVTGRQFGDQRLPAVHWVHEAANNEDSRIELWLGKLLDYLPIRLLIVQPAGDQLDMTLQNAYTQTMPPPAIPASGSQSPGNDRAH